MLVAILFLLLAIAGVIYYVPPFHWSIILLLIVLTSSTIFCVLKSVASSFKYAFLGSLLIFTVLCLLSLKLFDPVNVVLTISLFVGILILLK